jgi:hypothetical protein
VYRTYHNVDQAIKKLILEAFDDAYLNAISDEVVGYVNCTSLDILTHLLTYYAMIAPTELTQNYERLNTPYDPNQPIEKLFQQIQDARAFAVAGGQPYGAAMIINVAYTLVFNTGLPNLKSISPLLIANFVSPTRPHSSLVSIALT